MTGWQVESFWILGNVRQREREKKKERGGRERKGRGKRKKDSRRTKCGVQSVLQARWSSTECEWESIRKVWVVRNWTSREHWSMPFPGHWLLSPCSSDLCVRCLVTLKIYWSCDVHACPATDLTLSVCLYVLCIYLSESYIDFSPSFHKIFTHLCFYKSLPTTLYSAVSKAFSAHYFPLVPEFFSKVASSF